MFEKESQEHHSKMTDEGLRVKWRLDTDRQTRIELERNGKPRGKKQME